MKQTVIFLFFSAALAPLFLAGCSSTKEIQVLPPEQRFEAAMEKFNNGDYLDAIEDFKIITVQYPGSTVADKAQFYLGECRYERGEYILSASEFDLLIRTMPSSPLVPKARYMRAMSYYELSPRAQLDQKYTREAVDDFQSFIEYSPNDSLVKDAEQKIVELDDKLAKKQYDDGMLYYRLEYYKAAIVYFDYVLEHYHDSQYADDAQLGKARALFQRKHYDESLDAVKVFLAKYPGSDLLPQVKKLESEIEQAIPKKTGEAASGSSMKSTSSAGDAEWQR
ncbi:MAG: outer membrane protein assembly factor BamD [Bacteroidota bacterium]|nr:outer membrane protein assembly factor BamD [Bacteroidota bacterium]